MGGTGYAAILSIPCYTIIQHKRAITNPTEHSDHWHSFSLSDQTKSQGAFMASNWKRK